ncbi:hypothetical protein NC652_041185 [Populus alba x Populus x berolinensis]|nr:hypothetical protein NC652_041185 [Populus alba x Populus x berolinensis]
MRHYYVPHSCTLYYFEGESRMTDWYAVLASNYENTKRNCCDESKSSWWQKRNGEVLEIEGRRIKSRGRSTVNPYGLTCVKWGVSCVQLHGKLFLIRLPFSWLVF